MERPAKVLLLVLGGLAAWGGHWGASMALRDSADLLRRAEEVALFQARLDPYADPDLTYPPSAPPVFAALIGGIDSPNLPAVWLGLNLLGVAALAAGLVRVWGGRCSLTWQVSLVLVVLASRPVRAGLALGQFHVLPLALAVWALPALRNGRSALAGVLLGLSLIKPTMTLPLLGLWAIGREWRACGWAIGVQATLILVCSAWVGVAPTGLMREWIVNARTQEAAGTIDVPTLLAQAWPSAPLSGTALTGLVLVAGLAVLFALRRSDGRGLAALALGLGAVFAYHRHYDLVLLLPVLAYLGRRVSEEPTRLRMLLLATFAALLIAPTNPAPLRRFEPWIAGAFVMVSYAALTVVACDLRGMTRWASEPRGAYNDPEGAGASLGVGSRRAA